MIVKNAEKKENNTFEFQVESDAAEFEAAVNGAYLKNKSSISIPGFRKGKAPRQVIEGMYGSEVFYQDAMDELAPKAFELGITENDVKFVGTPSIKDVQVNDGIVSYTFSVELYPEVTLGQYKGIEATREAVEVSDEEVDEEIAKTRKQNARMVSVDDRAAQMGDTVKIDFDGYLNGERFDGGKAENYSLELGSNSFVPGFEEQVAGMSIGEEKDIDITFPETYVENLAGKAVVFKIKLNEITYAEMPELDDEFAKDVSEFDTFEEYKASVKADIEKKYKDQAENALRSTIIKTACDNMTVTVPDSMIKEKAEEIIREYAANFGLTDKSVEMDKLTQMLGIDATMMNQSILPMADFQVRNDLLIEAVIKAEGIESNEEETKAYLNKVAESLGATAEQLEQYFGLDFIAKENMKEKATAVIIDSAVVTDAE